MKNRLSLQKKALILLCLGCFMACQTNTQKGDTNGENTDTLNQTTSANKAEDKADYLITCEGIGKLKYDFDYKKVEETFGKENIENSLIEAGTELMDGVAEKDIHSSTITTPQGKLYIIWKSTKEPKRIIEDVSMDIDSKFELKNGLKVGSPLADLLKANGNQAFSFYGFGWEFGGLIAENNTGKFFDEYPCLAISIGPKNDQYDRVEDFMGDGMFRTDGKGLPLEEIHIRSIFYKRK